MRRRQKFRNAFHVMLIISAISLTACGYKGPPVYKEANKTIDFNQTAPIVPSNLNQL